MSTSPCDLKHSQEALDYVKYFNGSHRQKKALMVCVDDDWWRAPCMAVLKEGQFISIIYFILAPKSQDILRISLSRRVRAKEDRSYGILNGSDSIFRQDEWVIVPINRMLEEQAERDEGEAASQRLKNLRVSQQVVKLLQQKTIPLNRLRYFRLQTIAKQNANLSTPHLVSDRSQPLPRMPKSRTSRGQAMPTVDLLINRLKNLKDLKHSSQLLVKDEQAGRCWEALRNSIIESEQSRRSGNPSHLQSEKSVKIISQCGRRKRENLLQVAEKAERHLRMKKHELKEKHCQQEEYIENRRKKPAKQTEIQALLTTLRDLKQGGESHQKQLQLQLLRDIRETMLQEKINRIKKDINHKKIVQLR